MNKLGGEEVKKLTPNFGSHPNLITTHGRLVGLKTAAVYDIPIRSSDLDGLGVDSELRIVWASLSPPCSPEAAPVEAWRGAVRAPDKRELLPTGSGGRR